jgi:hypothetical protein
MDRGAVEGGQVSAGVGPGDSREPKESDGSGAVRVGEDPLQDVNVASPSLSSGGELREPARTTGSRAPPAAPEAGRGATRAAPRVVGDSRNPASTHARPSALGRASVQTRKVVATSPAKNRKELMSRLAWARRRVIGGSSWIKGAPLVGPAGSQDAGGAGWRVAARRSAWRTTGSPLPETRSLRSARPESIARVPASGCEHPRRPIPARRVAGCSPGRIRHPDRGTQEDLTDTESIGSVGTNKTRTWRKCLTAP